MDPSGATCEQESACPPGFASELLPLGENANGYEEYYRPRDGMVLIRLPAGQFEQGDHFLDYTLEEVPVHEVSISRDFYLGKYEVTNAQYHRFLESIGCTDPEDDDYDRSFDFDGAGANDYDGNHYPEGFERFAWARNENYFEDPSYADYPVLWVDWFDAVAYGRWADQQSSKNWEDPRAYGIPTESEWEYAARFHPSGEPRRYPWGGGGDRALDHPDSIDPRLANYGNNSGRTMAACSHPAGRSHFGLFNLSGNAYEWTADWFDGEYYGVSPRVDPFVSEGSGFRQLRGGGWFGAPFSQRGAYRCNFRPQTPDVDVGFRAVAR